MRLFLLLEAMSTLVRFEYAARRGFDHVHALMNAHTMNRTALGEVDRFGPETARSICAAVNTVCSFYPKSVQCLQRAGVVAWMLKKRGLATEVVIGIKKFPFQAHAWVELDNIVVNDHPRVRDKYLPIERYGANISSSVNARGAVATQTGGA